MTDPTNEQDTRPEQQDDRRTPDDNRFGYGSDGYDAGEGNDTAVTGSTEPQEQQEQ